MACDMGKASTPTRARRALRPVPVFSLVFLKRSNVINLWQFWRLFVFASICIIRISKDHKGPSSLQAFQISQVYEGNWLWGQRHGSGVCTRPASPSFRTARSHQPAVPLPGVTAPKRLEPGRPYSCAQLS